MKIPAFLYGSYPKVKSACRRKAKELKRGAAFADLPANQWLDTMTTPGDIAVDNISRSIPRQPEHFYCFALAIAIRDEREGTPLEQLLDNIMLPFYEAALLEPWLFLGALGQHSTFFLDWRPEWQGPFVRAAVEFWPLFSAEGARYTLGVSPEELWDLPTNISFALARLGIPQEKFEAPLPPGGLITLAREVLPDL